MLKYLEDNYEDGREPVNSSILTAILEETIRMTSGGKLLPIDYKSAVKLFLTSINYFFFLHPEQYVDFGKFVGYRSTDLKNLWTVEAKPGETAESIYHYMKNGGLQAEELKNLVEQFATDFISDSEKRIKELSEDIEDMGSIVSQDNRVQEKHKEKQNGI